MELTLTGQSVTLRPVKDGDAERLDEILREPSVARWWTAASAEGGAADWLEPFGQVTFVIEHDGEVVGSIQFSEEDDADYRSAGIDLFLTTSAQGRGLGPDAIRTVARYLFEERGHHRLTIDPSAANERAISAYTRVGFRPVGTMRQYERGQDGRWHDGLLMDMLAGELT
jgi:aminoglycoside 6'-N-acetyltransferase